MKLSFLTICMASIALSISCQQTASDPAPEITHASLTDFADSSEVSVRLASGFELNLWAPGPLLRNAVALSFDNQGVAYVSETSRRKSSDLDIREHRDWMIDDLRLQTIEDTRDLHLQKMATELSEQNTWQEDLNQDSVHDYRDLEVQSEYIRRVWDSDGDGRADASSLFAEDFNSMLTGVAAGVLWRDDEVFLTAAPDVWRLKDKDGNGAADWREVISHGYGIHIAYAGHDMSGLTTGPDGRVYWSIGDLGVNTVDQNGKRWAFPNEGAVMRCNPDGSDFEVFAHGLRNPQELAFDDYGNLISVDNDGDHAGEHERYVHIIEGSDTGWRINWQFGKYDQPNEEYKVWMDERLHVPHFKGQAAYILPPLALAFNGPAGLAYNPGTALGEAWKGHFFVSYFTGSSANSKIEAFRLEPKGASFSLASQVDAMVGIVPTGVAFGPDGALYFNDWKDGYAKKPAGRIWRLDVSNPNAARKETQQILAAGMGKSSEEELLQRMAHADQRVRLMAQFELVRRKSTSNLLEVAGSEDPLARVHAVWGIGQLLRKGEADPSILLPFLTAEDGHVRAQTAKVLGDVRYPAAYDALVGQLADSFVPAQFFAIEALGKLGDRRVLPELVKILEKTGDSDPHLRHGLMIALSLLEDEAGLVALASHSSADVRIGAVVALRRMAAPGVAVFLKDADPLVVTEAARAINDDLSIPAALPDLAAALATAEITDEAFLRRAINANLRLGGDACAQRLAAYAARTDAPEAMRADALWALGYWHALPVLDRVDGRYRGPADHPLAEAQQAIAPMINTLLTSGPVPVRAAAAELAGRLPYPAAEPELFRLAQAAAQPLSIRQAALLSLADLKSDKLAAALNVALADRQTELRQTAQAVLGQAQLPEAVKVEMLAKVLKNSTISEQQAALNSLGAFRDPAAEQLLGQWLDQLIAGRVDPALRLEVVQAVEESGFATLQEKAKQYEASKPADDLLAVFDESLYGGDARKGRNAFYRNNSAQCIRCHAINGQGGEVGPELSAIAGVLSREDLLMSLVNPSARLAPGYGTVILNLKAGEKVVGTLEGESAKVVRVKLVSGEIREVPLADIAQRQDAPSAMPTMKGVLTKSEIRDVVAFLAGLK